MKSLSRQLRAASLAAAAAIALSAGAAAADVKAGVDKWMAGNFTGAVAEWRPLADKGDADAQYNLGQAYKLGRGVPIDLALAKSWYEKAAQQGHEQAQINVGLLLYNGGRRSEALPWVRKAVELDDPRAQYILGIELFNGEIVTKDWPRAYGLMMRAADQGLPQAADNIKAMDAHIPLEQRQRGVQIAQQLSRAAAAAQPGASVPRVAGSVGRPHIPSPNSAIQSTVAAPSPKAPGPKAPATKTAARPPAPAPAAAVGGRWRVQLGAFGTAANAQRAWAGLKGKVGALAGLQPQMVAAGAVTRLQAGPLASRAAADRVCAAAKASGSACFPVAP
jgi:cell division septation protein DedD